MFKSINTLFSDLMQRIPKCVGYFLSHVTCWLSRSVGSSVCGGGWAIGAGLGMHGVVVEGECLDTVNLNYLIQWETVTRPVYESV